MWYYRYGLPFSLPSHSLIPIVVHNADSFAFIYTGFEISISEISASIPKMDEFPFVQLKALKDLLFFSRNKTTLDNPQTLLQTVFSLKTLVFRRSCKITRCVFSDSQRNNNLKNKKTLVLCIWHLLRTAEKHVSSCKQRFGLLILTCIYSGSLRAVILKMSECRDAHKMHQHAPVLSKSNEWCVWDIVPFTYNF